MIWNDSRAGDARHDLPRDRQNSRRTLAKISMGAVALTLALLSSGGLQATALFSFGPDNMNDPRSFTFINTTNSTSQALYNMNDLNDGFNGGVTFRGSDNLFYAIKNDSSGNSSLISFASIPCRPSALDSSVG